MITVTTHNANQTQHLAHALALQLKQGTLIFLHGHLASGKTTFTQGLGQGLNIQEIINSPTFVIMKQYQGRLNLIHIDAYRLENDHQDLGFEDYFQKENVVVVEWPQHYDFQLPDNVIHIYFEYVDETMRNITIDAPLILEQELLSCYNSFLIPASMI